MNRKKLTSTFFLDGEFPWACPSCNRYSLKIVESSFHKDITSQSHDICNHFNQWIPEEIEYKYSCLLKCQNKTCNEIISSVGSGFIDLISYKVVEGYDYPEPIYGDYYKPMFFEPSLNLISIPDRCPDSIREPLRESFKLFFSSTGSSANNARVAIEALLTEMEVPTKKIDKNGKPAFMPLHERIGKIPGEYNHVKDMLTAIKWIGNSGSHHGDAKPLVDDVIDIYELIEHVLEEVYAPRLSRLTAIAERINQNKGPGQ
ncbi:DUF4145 domain-containing protein [Citrobacter braakii]|uniref:DUF4145 domain-containing protein n=1 Tax=Citrobacter braakii TaxID=57706 RepID=UPI00115C38F5|nr:DUF4145 domain-containing protein [Citrobacter braakii]